MAGNEQVLRPWSHRNHSSTSLRGLEIAIPPGELYPRPSQSLNYLYRDKELPPVPWKKLSRRHYKPRKLSDTYKVMFGDGPYAEQYRKRSEDTTYRDELSEAELVVHHRPLIQTPNVYRSESEKVHNVSQKHPRFVGQDGTEGHHRQWSEIISPTYWEIDKGMRWSSSNSCYSREEDSKPASHRGSWSGVDSTEGVSPETPQGSFYLQPKTYSASTTEIDPNHDLSTKAPSNIATSLRHHDRPSLAVAVSTTPPARCIQTDQPGRAPIPPTPHKAMTLDDMISYERQRFETEEFSRDVWRPSHVLPSPRARMAPKIPSRGQHPPGSRYESIPTLLPRPLTLRQRRASNRESISHFSDHSLDEADADTTGKIFSQARSSVLSHIRKISTTTPKPKDVSLLANTMQFQVKHMSSPPKPSKRKKTYSNIRHPLRSPYPPQEMRMSPGNVQAQEHNAPLWPPLVHVRTPSLSRRLSSIMRRPSQLETPLPLPPPPQPPPSALEPQIQAKDPSIITDYARTASGPNTPLPESGKVGLISTLTPFLHKGKGVVTQVRQGVRVRSAAEKRRDKLRKEIVFIGPADQYPDGRVNSWF